MALTTQTPLGTHSFDGPHTNNNTLPPISGVYLVTTLAHNRRHTIIDVGESQNIYDRISNHDRSSQWQQHKQNGLYAWVLAANDAQRMLIERAHRIAYNPVCGDR
jgi:hypothetical protein